MGQLWLKEGQFFKSKKIGVPVNIIIFATQEGNGVQFYPGILRHFLMGTTRYNART